MRTELVHFVELHDDATGPALHALGLDIRALDAADTLIAQPNDIAALSAGHAPGSRVNLVVRLDDRDPGDVAADLARIDATLRGHDRAVRRVRLVVTGADATHPAQMPPAPGESGEAHLARLATHDYVRWIARRAT